MSLKDRLQKNANTRGTIVLQLQEVRLHVEAHDHDGSKIKLEKVLSLIKELPDEITTFFLVRAKLYLSKACLGLGDYQNTFTLLNEVSRLNENKTFLMEWFLYLPFYECQSEYWITQENYDLAKDYAEKLYTLAASAPQRSYLANVHKLLADIALKQNNFPLAQKELVAALDIVKQHEVPLSAWKVYEAASNYYRQVGNPIKAKEYDHQRSKALQKLADSPEGGDALRESILSKLSSHMNPSY